MGSTIAQKIIAAHLVSGSMQVGEDIGLRIDQTLTQDATGTMAYLEFEAMGVPRVKTERSVAYIDHNTLQSGFENADDHKFIQSVAKKHGIYFSKPGNGICHQLHLERFGVPGKTLIGSDSHTPTGGGIGMLAFGAGGMDVAVAMGGGEYHITMPKMMKINLTGKLSPWVSAKDVILAVLQKLSVKGGVALVGAVGAIILVAASKFMAVEEDPRIEEVAGCLAGANCGGCGYAGCADYAKAVVMDGVPCDKCAPGGPKAAAAIAKIMGGEASAVEKKAVVQCQGNTEHCKPSYDYKGIQTCAAAAALYGGPKTCSFACIGLGDCTKVCKFDAIHIVDGVAKVDKDKCTGCGACANTCPKKVIMIDAAGPRKPVVMCSNQDKGAVANKVCTTSCIACGMCERTCKFDAIHVVDGVARVDYDKCKGCGMCAQKCPKKIILFPLKDDPYPPKPVVKPAAPAAAKPAAPAAPAEKPETKAE